MGRATGQYAEKLWSIGVPGIGFPFGTGVSRTRYAYAALVIALVVRRFFRRAVAVDAFPDESRTPLAT